MVPTSVASELEQLGPATHGRRQWTLAAARDYCQGLAQRHYENFTVASRLLPRHLHPHFHAVYAYCRWADDLADETGDPARSLELLDWWQAELQRCYLGQADHPVFVALGETIREFEIPPAPFLDLLTAFRQDQATTRYATHAEVLDYCRNSAAPVGRLVLYLGRCHDAQRGSLADDICTGLQLVNFCQDVARDWQRGRIYLPAETLDRAGYDERMFARGEFNAAFREVLSEEVERAEMYLRRGEPLVGLMPRELRLDVALFVAGGLAAAEGIRRVGFDVWRERPRVTKWTQLRLLATCWWRTHSGKHNSTARRSPA